VPGGGAVEAATAFGRPGWSPRRGMRSGPNWASIGLAQDAAPVSAFPLGLERPRPARPRRRQDRLRVAGR
jgi:hypothetical protein